MDRYLIVSELAKDFPDSRVRVGVQKPVPTKVSIRDNRKRCAENLCGNYNKSCTCPPRCGSDVFCIDRISGYKDADIFIRTFKVDVKDEKALKSVVSKFQRNCRDIMIECKRAGFDILVLAEGPCNNCDRCAALDEKDCPHPELQIPSVSGYGIKMDEYLSSIGEKFEFRDDEATFYGIILFK